MTEKTLGRKGKDLGKKADADKIGGAPSAGRKRDSEGIDGDPFDHWLEDKLRNAYSSVLEEPIPEDLLKLLHAKLKD